MFEELAAVREKVNAQEPLGATVYWFADACAQVAFESARVYAVRDGPASGATVKGLRGAAEIGDGQGACRGCACGGDDAEVELGGAKGEGIG